MTLSIVKQNRWSQQTDSGLLAALDLHLDEGAFAEIVRRYQRLVMSVCLRTTRSREDADDAFQATFLALARQSRKVRSAECLSSWLYTVAWRISVRVNRMRKKQSATTLPEALTDEFIDPFDQIARSCDRAILDEELNQLSENHRSVLVQNCLVGLSTAKIAEEIGTTKGVIDGRLKRAKNELRVRLMRRGVTLSVLGTVLATADPAQAVEVAGQTIPQISLDATTNASCSTARRLARYETSSIPTQVWNLFAASMLLMMGGFGVSAVPIMDFVAADEPAVVLSSVVESGEASSQSKDAAERAAGAEKTHRPAEALSNQAQSVVAATERVFRGFGEHELHSAKGSWGGVSGQILFDGEVPESDVLANRVPPLKANAVCGSPIADDSLLVHPITKGVANCFVYLRRPPKQIHHLLRHPSELVVIQDQKNCVFEPHALVVQVGQTVRSISSDTVPHNVRTVPLRNQAISILVPANGAGGVPFRPRVSEILPFEVRCDLHSWMKAYWLVTDHPYAAKTDKYGNFFIAGLPVGDHKFRIWHERIGYIDREYHVTISEGEVIEMPPLSVSASMLGR